MKLDLENTYSNCTSWCLRRGILYSPDSSCCQSCEYNIAVQILKEILKQETYCNCCSHVQHIKGGYTECSLGYGGWQECGENYGVDWNAIVKEYDINIEEGDDCNQEGR